MRKKARYLKVVDIIKTKFIKKLLQKQNDNYIGFEILKSSLKQNSLKNLCRSKIIIVFELEIL